MRVARAEASLSIFGRRLINQRFNCYQSADHGQVRERLNITTPDSHDGRKNRAYIWGYQRFSLAALRCAEHSAERYHRRQFDLTKEENSKLEINPTIASYCNHSEHDKGVY
jgi:hypothetical protein